MPPRLVVLVLESAQNIFGRNVEKGLDGFLNFMYHLYR
jgi:hypothetical protein